MSTLTALRDKVEADLRDTTNVEWTTAELDAHIRTALNDVNRYCAQRLRADIPAVTGQRFYNIAAFAALEVLDLFYPVNTASPPHPLPRTAWSMPYDATIYLQADDDPLDDGEHDMILLYTKAHTIEGLDGAAATTLTPRLEDLVQLGTTARALIQLGTNLTNTVTVGAAALSYLAEGRRRLTDFREQLFAEAGRQFRTADPRVHWDAEI